MSSKIIRFEFRVADVLTNVTSAVLADPASPSTYGVKRDDTDDTVIAANVSMGGPVSTGVYSYTFDDPAGYTGPYTAWIKVVYSGATYHFERNIPATASVSIGGMTVSYTELKERVGRGVFGIRTGFSDAQLDDINDCIREGLHSVYTAHRWSFFRPLTTITTSAPFTTGTVTVSSGVVTFTDAIPSWAASGVLTFDDGTYQVASRDSGTQVTLEDTSVDADALTTFSLDRPEYDLPTDFDSFDTPMLTYEPEKSLGYPPIKIVHESLIRHRRQVNEYTDRPVLAAVRTVEFDSTVGSRRRIVFYPTPDAAYVLTGRMRLRPTMLDDSNPYPVGAEALADVITEACLAAGERHLDDGEGVHSKRFEQILPLAIRVDQDAASPNHLGPDRGGEERAQWPPAVLMGAVSFNGTEM